LRERKRKLRLVDLGCCVGRVDVVVAEAGAVSAIGSVWRRRLFQRVRIQRGQRFVVHDSLFVFADDANSEFLDKFEKWF
jgi:hypothetical protein